MCFGGGSSSPPKQEPPPSYVAPKTVHAEDYAGVSARAPGPHNKKYAGYPGIPGAESATSLTSKRGKMLLGG